MKIINKQTHYTKLRINILSIVSIFLYTLFLEDDFATCQIF